MTDFYLRSTTATERANSTAYSLGARVVLARADAQTSFATMRRYVFEATVAGTSAASVPVYPTVPGNTVVDGGVTWTCRECSSWDNAAKYMDYVASRLAVSDRLLVSHAHAETSAVTITMAFAGTFAAPNQIICVNDSTGLPATTATITTTANGSVTLTGSFWCYGHSFFIGTSSGSPTFSSLGAANNVQVFEASSAQAVATGNVVFNYGAARSDVQKITLRGQTYKFSAITQRIAIQANMLMEGGSVLAGGTTPTNLFYAVTNALGEASIIGSDFSALGPGFNLLSNSGALGTGMIIFSGIKLPVGWSGSLWSATPTVPGLCAEMRNCWIGTTKLRRWRWNNAGQARDDTTVYRTNGAVDDTVPYSIKITSLAGAQALTPFRFQIQHYVNVAGSAVTLALEVRHDAQGSGTAGALTNADIALSLLTPDGHVDTAKVTPLTADTTYDASAETWVGADGMTSQKLSLTFTPTSKGPVLLSVDVFAASKVIYLCQKVST